MRKPQSLINAKWSCKPVPRMQRNWGQVRVACNTQVKQKLKRKIFNIQLLTLHLHWPGWSTWGYTAALTQNLHHCHQHKSTHWTHVEECHRVMNTFEEPGKQKKTGNMKPWQNLAVRPEKYVNCSLQESTCEDCCSCYIVLTVHQKICRLSWTHNWL